MKVYSLILAVSTTAAITMKSTTKGLYDGEKFEVKITEDTP